MNKKNFIPTFVIMTVLTAATLQTGMARRGQYDEEAREQERVEKAQQKSEGKGRHINPFKEIASGVKQATVDSAAGLISDTTESTRENPLTGTVEGARQGSEKVLDNTVRGVSKIATLGYGEVHHYEVQEPESGKDEPTKIKIKIPGT